MSMTETEHQRAFMKHVLDMRGKDSRYYLVTSTGKTHQQAHIGLFPKGYPDTQCLIPNQTYHGLFMEFKVAPNKLEPEQEKWNQRLNAWGYLCLTVWSSTEAIGALAAYLSFAKFTPSERVEYPDTILRLVKS